MTEGKTPEDDGAVLRRAGISLFGEDWQEPMAAAIRERVPGRHPMATSVEAWAAGRPPTWVMDALWGMLMDAKRDLDSRLAASREREARARDLLERAKLGIAAAGPSSIH